MPQRLPRKFMISTSKNLTDDEIRKPVLKKLEEDDLLAIVAYLASLVPQCGVQRSADAKTPSTRASLQWRKPTTVVVKVYDWRGVRGENDCRGAPNGDLRAGMLRNRDLSPIVRLFE